ncbi:MAG: hypothetical protein JXR53_12295 [Bacteroidales bacterium]|nr:hypothetical protein [Bacteroidales bacterium]
MRQLLLLMFVVFIVGCNKPDPCEESYFSNDFKAYTFFPTGSYWVYQDTSSNVTDSVNLVYSNITLNDYCNATTEYEEILEQRFYSSFFNNGSPSLSVWAHASTYYNQSQDYPMGVFYESAEQIDSMEVNNVWYTDIRAIKFSQGTAEFYWAKDVGLIRKVMPEAHLSDSVVNFDLVRYYINN